jgi:hypothetical protein
MVSKNVILDAISHKKESHSQAKMYGIYQRSRVRQFSRYLVYADARRTTFYFTLPIVSKEQHCDNNMIVY